MRRTIKYRKKSFKNLLDTYAFENGRENKEDAKITRELVVYEINARIKETLAMLDNGEDLEAVYRKLLNPIR